MIFASHKTKAERYAICQSCEHFKEITRSCGTFLPQNVMRGQITGDVVEHNGKKVTLCGCVMSQKTKFKSARCPLGKWPSEIKASDIKKMKKLIEQQGGKRIASREWVEEVVKLYNASFEARRTIGGCHNCMNDLLTEIKEAISQYES